MAGPLAGISAAQVAQQKLPEAAQQGSKAGASKFDQSMKSHGADHAQKAQHAQAANQIQKIDQAKQIDQTNKIDKTAMNKADRNLTSKAMEPVGQKAEVSKATSMVSGLLANMEKGQASLDKLIQGSLNGKQFSNSEMIGLQAGMYKYSQELDLTSKVVEKATSGLKETLKTNV